MIITVIEHIRNYINWLTYSQNLSITIHGVVGSDQLLSGDLTDYNLHCNPYCLYLKTCAELWDKCVTLQKKVIDGCSVHGAYFGMCHVGVCEFVYPLKIDDHVVGFISVSGYRAKDESELHDKAMHKLHKLCSNYGFSFESVLDMYNTSLNPDLPDVKWLDTLIYPLCDMIELYCMNRRENRKLMSPASMKNDNLYNSVCQLIRRTHNSKVSLDYICRNINYSKSYISHLFKSRSGMTINQYVNRLRIGEAKSLLTNTNMSVQEVAMSIGFTDSNYFSNVFRASTGMSPREWRKVNNSNNKEICGDNKDTRME